MKNEEACQHIYGYSGAHAYDAARLYVVWLPTEDMDETFKFCPKCGVSFAALSDEATRRIIDKLEPEERVRVMTEWGLQ